jgi:hypothetical protein
MSSDQLHETKYIHFYNESSRFEATFGESEYTKMAT